MVQRFTESDFFQFFVKFIIPAICGIGIKVAIEMKKDKTKVSFFNVCLSMFIGVAGAYIFSALVQKNFGGEYQPVVIAFIAIITDKIAEYIIYKWNVDIFLSALFDGLFDLISNTFKRK